MSTSEKQELQLALLRAKLILQVNKDFVQLVALDLPQDKTFPQRMEEKRTLLEVKLLRLYEEVLG